MITVTGDYSNIIDDIMIMKITQFSDFAKKGSKL